MRPEVEIPCSSSPPSSTLVVIAIERSFPAWPKKRPARPRQPVGANPTGGPPSSRPYRGRRGRRRRELDAVDISAAIERFLASPALADATRRSYRFDLEPFGRWLEERAVPLEEVDARVLAEYVARLG